MSDTLDSKTDSVFAYRRERLEEMARDVLRIARELGATDAATEISEGQGLSVTVRKGEIETIEQNRDKVVGVTVMLGKKRGNASTSDFSPAALRSTVEAAYNIARFTADDDCAGLAEEELLERQPRDLSLYHPWTLDAEAAVEIARAAEAAAFAVSPRSATATAPACRRSIRISSWRPRAGSWAAIRIRGISFRARRSPARASRCSATTGIRPSARPRTWRHPRPSASTLPSARWRGSPRAG